MKPTVDSARRRFFWHAGAAPSAPLAVVAASASASTAEDSAALEARLALLEDVNAIPPFHHAYVKHVNAGAHDAVASLFADPAGARLDAAIRALPADPLGAADAIEIAADSQRATARLHCTVRTETPSEPSCPLIEMGRAQGGGVTKLSDRGMLESVYVKQDGLWKIERLVFRSA
jgi:hypothetical protein